MKAITFFFIIIMVFGIFIISCSNQPSEQRSVPDKSKIIIEEIQNSDDLFSTAKKNEIPYSTQLRLNQYGVQGYDFLLTDNTIEIEIGNTLIDRDLTDFQISSKLCQAKSEKVTLIASKKNRETFILKNCKTYLTEMKNFISDKITEAKNFEIPLAISYTDSKTNSVVENSGILKITITYSKNV